MTFVRSAVRHPRLLLAAALTALAVMSTPVAAAPRALVTASADVAPAAPTPSVAAQLFAQPAGATVTLKRQEVPVPGWSASAAGEGLGLIGSTWELARSTGYSGRPLDVLVAVTPQGIISGARLMRHNEPVLTLGISTADIEAYVGAFANYDTARTPGDTLATEVGLPDVISRATVSTGVIRDGILRSARVLATGQGIGAGGIDRVSYEAADWQAIVDSAALSEVTVTMAEAAKAFAGARQPVTPSEKPFIDLWAGIIDTPTVGRNLLGQAAFTAATGAAAPGEALLAILSRGVSGHRGIEWRKTGIFDQIAITQGDVRLVPTDATYIKVAGLEAEGSPVFKERSLFRINADPAQGGIDLAEPLAVTVTLTRAADSGPDLTLPVTTEVLVPEAFRIAPPAPAQPLWLEFWQIKRPQIAIVGVMLAALGLILFAQEWLVRRKALYHQVRLGFLAVTLVVLGWGIGGQLSVVQVVAFLHSLLSGFRWETFLVAPVIFLLWSTVALGMLFWGRGVYCGWLCPFGALQELTNNAAQRLGVKQIAVPQALHERLWVIKYTLFVAIVALSFYSMERALILAEAEPFKTAISMRFMRAWPFVLYVVVLLGAGLFIERFFCRYLCPLGAGLAIPAKLKVFDWLKRRPQCGRECRLCETKCTVGAIDALGRINPNECILCLRCQVIMEDPDTCPVLKRRARGASTGGQVPASAHAAAAGAPPPAYQSQVQT